MDTWSHRISTISSKVGIAIRLYRFLPQPHLFSSGLRLCIDNAILLHTTLTETFSLVPEI